MSKARLIAVVVAMGAMAVVGFEAGRRYPWAIVDQMFAGEPVPPPGWVFRAKLPAARYEAARAVIGNRVFMFGGFHESALRALARVDVYDIAAGSWQRKNDMPTALTHSNAVVIEDTVVWFAGGFVGDDPGAATAATLQYHPASDTWVQGPPLPQPRAGGALVHLGAALHYVGGYGADRDTGRTEHWTLDLARPALGWQPAPPLPRGRGHAAGVALEGRLYVIGGAVRHDPVQVDVDWVDCFDPATARWTAVASLPLPRSHTEPSTFAYRDRIVIAGGRDNTAEPRATDVIFAYTPATDTWVPVGRTPEARVAPVAVPVGDSIYFAAGADATFVAVDVRAWSSSLANPWRRLAPAPIPFGEVSVVSTGESLLLVGQDGSQTLRYDIARDRWDPPDSRARRPVHGHHHASEWIDDKWYLIGGLDVAANRRLQIYDVARDRWTFGPDIPWGAGSAASGVINGALYLAGGIEGDKTLGRVARFDVARSTWTELAPMPLPRNHAASATDGRKLYVFGGRGPGSGDANEIANGFAETQIFDPATNRWSTSGSGPGAPAPLPQARGGMGKAVYARGEFWVFGGETLNGAGATPDGVYDRVDIYDPVRNSWRAGPPMPTPRHGIFPVLVGNRIYIIAGGTKATRSNSTVVEYLDLDLLPAQR